MFKIMNSNGKYITTLPDSNKIVLKDKLNRIEQNVSYNAQGELIIDGKCITTSDGSTLKMDDCNNSKGQKWIIKNNKLILYDNKKCISDNTNNDNTDNDNTDNDNTYNDNTDNDNTDNDNTDNDNTDNIYNNDESDISLRACNQNTTDSSEQTWFQELIDKNKDNIFKGKNVILVNTDDPWYINKEFTIPQKYIDNNLSSLDNNLEYDYGDFNSYFNINNKRADLGYGYSYASRLGEKCNEHFTNTKKKINENNIYDNDYTSIIILLCILLIIIFLYRRF
jgi:hypothetical protein